MTVLTRVHPSDVVKIRELTEEGFDARDIAYAMGLSINSVRFIRARTDDQLADLDAMYKDLQVDKTAILLRGIFSECAFDVLDCDCTACSLA